MTSHRRTRTQTVHEDAGESVTLRAPAPPETIVRGRVQCGHCSVTHQPINPTDTHPQCPWCGNLIDLTEYVPEHPPDDRTASPP